MIRPRLIHSCCPLLLSLIGCASTPVTSDEAARQQALSLLMPRSIEIVESFTRVKSFDDDSTPDGIELLLQAVNFLDDPGPIVGGVRVELFEHVPASGDNKGRRLDHWGVDLSTVHQQRTFWNQVTQMYEFRLRVDPGVIPPRDQFVLLVTYNSPLGEHLTDECIIDYRLARRAWTGSPQSNPVSP